MRRQWAFVIVLLLTFALAGCGATASAAQSGSQSNLPTALLVTRSTGLNNDPPFRGESTDAAAVQRLFAAVKALPRAGNAAINCPFDNSVMYTLTFTRDGAAILTATVEANGCRGLSLGPNDTRWTNDSFWTLLARTVGIPATEIHPVP